MPRLPHKRRVVMLSTAGQATNIVYNALAREFPDLELILEERVPRLQLVKGRYRRLGLLPVVSQLAFIGLAMPVLRSRSASRIRAILREHELDDTEPRTYHRVASVNSDEARKLLQARDPGCVVVFGTRIIGRTTLRSVNAPFVNMHAGITPRYRGVHGGYWALADGRPDLVGTTVHAVDEGIDTGAIVEQVNFDVTSEDNFATYPYLHIAAGLAALERAVHAALEGGLQSLPGPDGPSVLRYHPGLIAYLRGAAR